MHPKDLTQWCLFIMDDHNSHITVNFIAFCMKYLINLFILFPHTSHLLQLLNVSVFAPLKRTLAEKTDANFRFDFSHISRANWVSMFIWVRSRTLISSNVLAGWKNTGLKPFQPQEILQTLWFWWTFIISKSFTFSATNALNLLLLANFFPNGIELCNVNCTFKFALQKSTNLFSPQVLWWMNNLKL